MATYFLCLLPDASDLVVSTSLGWPAHREPGLLQPRANPAIKGSVKNFRIENRPRTGPPRARFQAYW